MALHARRACGRLRGPMWSDLKSHERRVYSQCGEDGVLEFLFRELGVRAGSFVEFGAKDGRSLSNTANLRLHHGWTGLLMDAGAAPDDPLVRREFVTAENIEALLARYEVPRDLDLLSIDIDGNDYWVWKAIEGWCPRVVVVEYNIFFAPDDAKTMPYDPDHLWDETSYHGASLEAFRQKARPREGLRAGPYGQLGAQRLLRAPLGAPRRLPGAPHPRHDRLGPLHPAAGSARSRLGRGLTPAGT